SCWSPFWNCFCLVRSWLRSTPKHSGGNCGIASKERGRPGQRLLPRGRRAGTAGAERVADGKETWVYQTNDVAWIGLFNRLPVTAKESMRSRHSDLPVQPRMIDHHILLKAARYDAQKRHSVAMLWIHVRLNLEDKAGELVVRR